MKRIGFLILLFFSVKCAFAQQNLSKSICSGGVVNLASTDFGLPDTTTYTWNYSVAAGTVVGYNSNSTPTKIFNQSLSLNGNTVGVVVYFITPSYGNPFTVTINVNPTSMIVDPSAIAPVICSGSNFNAAVSGVPPTTQYTWSVPVMSTGVGLGAAQSTPQPYILQQLSYTGSAGTSGTATYTVTPIVGGCTNPTFNFTVTINPAVGTAPIINNATTITPKCSGSTISYSATASPSSGVTFSWVRPTQYGISQNSNLGTNNAINEVLNDTLSTHVSAYYFYNLSYGSGKCMNTYVVSITIDPIANITPKTVAACSGSPFTVNINDIIPANTRYTWTNPSISSGSGTVTGAAAQSSQVSIIGQGLSNNPVNRTTPVTLNYTVTPIAITGSVSCTSPTFPVTVTLNPVSTITQQTAITCSNQPFNISLTAFPPGTNFTWSLAPTIAPNTSALTGGTNQTTPTNVISQTLINTTNQAATATYLITPITGNCVGTQFNAIVTVNPTPNIVNLNQSVTICSGATLNLPQSGVPSNTLYTWSMPTIIPSNTVNGATSLNAQTVFSQTLNNITNNPVTATYSITPVAGSCAGASFNVTATINPVANYSTQTYNSCSGVNFTFNPYNAPSGTNYTWNIPSYPQNSKLSGGTSQAIPQNNITQNLINLADTASIAKFTITPNTNGCIGPDFNLLVTVNPLPVVADLQNSNCSGSPFNIIPQSSIPGTLYTWNLPEIPLNNLTGGTAKTTPTNSINGTLFNATLSNANAKYTVTPIANGCVGNSFNLIETINPVPSVALINQKICSNTAFDASPTGLPTNALTLYTWNTPVISPANALTGGSQQDIAVTNVSQNLTNITNAVATASYNVTPITGACAGTPFKVVVTVTPRAAQPDLSATICSGGTFITVPNNSPAGTKFSWIAPNVSTGILGGSANTLYVDTISQTLINSNSNVSVGSATYLVTPITDGCIGNNFRLNVNVNSSNAALSSSLNPSAVCSNNPFSYTPTSNIDGTAFLWNRDSIAGIDNSSKFGYGNINETLINNTTDPITVKYYFTLSSNGCTNLNKQTVFLVVNPTPKLSSTTNPSSICSGSNFNYSATSGTINVIFNWRRNYIAGINEQITNGSGNITEVLTNKTSNILQVPYTYTLTANGCTNQQSVYLFVNPVVTSPDINVNACSGSIINITPNNVPQNTQYVWTYLSSTGGISGATSQYYVSQSSIAQKLYNSTSSTQNAIYQVTPSLPSAVSAGCTGKPFNLTIVVNPLPTLTSSSVSNPICSNTEFNYVPTSNIVGTTFTWFRDALTGLQNSKSSGSGNIRETLIDTTTNQLTLYYKFVLSANGCNDTSYTLKVPINPAPVLTDKSINICSGNTFRLPADLMPNNTTYKWGTPQIIPSNSLTGYTAASSPQTLVSDSLYNNTLNNATAIYTIQPLNSVCNIPPFNLIVNSIAIPKVLDQEINVCSGSTFAFIPNKIPLNTTFQWQNPISQPYGIVTGYVSDSLQHKNISQRLINVSNANSKAIFTVSPFNNGCAGGNFNLIVNVNPIPTYSVSALKSICQNIEDTFYINLLGNGPWSLTYFDNKSGLPNTIKNITSPTQKIVQFSLPDTSSYQFKLLNLQDAFCYNDTTTTLFTQQILPLPHDSIYAPKGNQLCINQSLPLSINNSSNILNQWYLKDSLFVQTNSNTIQVSKTGIYNAVTKNNFGCSSKTINSIEMKQLFENPIISFKNDVSCKQIPITFLNTSDTTTTGHINWTWKFSDTDSLNGFNVKYTFSESGSKLIKLIAKSTICNNIITKDTTILIRAPKTGIELPPVTTYLNTNTRIHGRNIPGDIYTYKWEPAWGLDSNTTLNPLFNFNLNQVYQINYIDGFGCITTDTLPVYVFNNGLIDMFVPKSFSPNGDGVNDELYVYLAGISNFHFFKIYNKFGQLVFQSNSPELPWNGTVNGVLQPFDVYVWIAEGEDINNKLVTKTGSVLLLR
jgi:gliding motility-associated-like protein